MSPSLPAAITGPTTDWWATPRCPTGPPTNGTRLSGQSSILSSYSVLRDFFSSGPSCCWGEIFYLFQQILVLEKYPGCISLMIASFSPGLENCLFREWRDTKPEQNTKCEKIINSKTWYFICLLYIYYLLCLLYVDCCNMFRYQCKYFYWM